MNAGTARDIVRLGESDADAAATLHGACFARGWDAAAFATFLANPNMLGLGTWRAEAPAGLTSLLLMRQAADEAEILTLAVASELRRTGLARALCRNAFAVLAETGVHDIFLEVATANAGAQALYRALGFAQVGARPGYYTARDGGPDDAVILGLSVRVG